MPQKHLSFMKKHGALFYTLLGISVIALLILITRKSEQPKPVELNLSEKPRTKEHNLVSEVLADTESFTTKEDAAVNQASQLQSFTTPPLPVAGAPLPVAWDSQSAPDIDEVELSPSLKRSLSTSASLQSKEYTDPNSELNLDRIEDLRLIRQNRHQSE